MPPVPNPLTPAAGDGLQTLVDRVDLGQQCGRGVARRIGGHQARLIGQHDQQVGAGQQRHASGEVVIVTHFDFRRRHGVVFVDNRHNIGRQQS